MRGWAGLVTEISRTMHMMSPVTGLAWLPEGYPVNSPTCKLAYANSPTPTGELAYVGEFEHQHKRVRCPLQLCKMRLYSSFFYPLPSHKSG